MSCAAANRPLGTFPPSSEQVRHVLWRVDHCPTLRSLSPLLLFSFFFPLAFLTVDFNQEPLPLCTVLSRRRIIPLSPFLMSVFPPFLRVSVLSKRVTNHWFFQPFLTSTTHHPRDRPLSASPLCRPIFPLLLSFLLRRRSRTPSTPLAPYSVSSSHLKEHRRAQQFLLAPPPLPFLRFFNFKRVLRRDSHHLILARLFLHLTVTHEGVNLSSSFFPVSQSVLFVGPSL